jgi:hypothetical protein
VKAASVTSQYISPAKNPAMSKAESAPLPAKLPDVALVTIVAASNTGAVCPLGANPWRRAPVAGALRPSNVPENVVLPVVGSTVALHEPIAVLVVGGTS